MDQVSESHESNLPAGAVGADHSLPARNSVPRRFVILHHSIGESEHWDLMVEQGDWLATWRLGSNPLGGGFPIAAERIGNHRKAYLEYEGPVSGNRGEVRRIESGLVKVGVENAEEFTASVNGKIFKGAMTLRRKEGSEWALEFTARENGG